MDESSFNPYRTPASILEVAGEQREPELAGRAMRLGAFTLDTIFRLALVAPLLWYAGFFSTLATEQFTTAQDVAWSVFAVTLYLALQAYPLHRWGQTWGKRLVGICIVDLQGRKPSLPTLLGTRYGVFEFGFLVPVAGELLVLFDTLAIFRRDRRCLHDLAAGTIVVKVDSPPRATA
jgi:uncharacterized RDD family membrane protein YckC